MCTLQLFCLLITGALGIDFSSFTSAADAEKGVSMVAEHLLEHGVTSFCPTVVTSLPDYYKMVCNPVLSLPLNSGPISEQVLPAMKPIGHHGAAVLGL